MSGFTPLGLYTYSLIMRLLYADTFSEQVRVLAGLASLLEELGDEGAEEVLKTIVGYEGEAELLDAELRELRAEVARGVVLEFPPELRERVERLRYTLERFKARLLSRLDELVSKVPVVRGE